MKKYGTLKALVEAPESEIAQLLHMRADMATSLILAAKVELEKQEERKEKQMDSLVEAGTTWQKAARSKHTANLAALALQDDDDDGTLMVASPDDLNEK